MDEVKLGKAIGEAVVDANKKIMAEGFDCIRNGFFVSVSAEEMAVMLKKRASEIRSEVEEFLATGPAKVCDFPGAPTHLRHQGYSAEDMRRIGIEGRKSADRLDFLADHVIVGFTYKLSPDELARLIDHAGGIICRGPAASY